MLSYKENCKRPVGSYLYVPHKEFGDIEFVVIGHDHDREGTATILTSDIIKCMPFDGAEPNNPLKSRPRHGSNRYSHSNLLQWLNSDKETDWYVPQHEFDEPPTPENVVDGFNSYANKPGFLCGFDDEFRSLLVDTYKKTVLCDCDGGGYEYVTSKMFLLSRTEAGLGSEKFEPEGHVYEWFKESGMRRIAKYSIDAMRKNEITSYAKYVGGGQYYWLRTPNTDYNGIVHCVRRVGRLGNNHASYNNIGLRVACVIDCR